MENSSEESLNSTISTAACIYYVGLQPNVICEQSLSLNFEHKVFLHLFIAFHVHSDVLLLNLISLSEERSGFYDF